MELIIVVAIIAECVFAAVFANIASQKGHSWGVYFGVCFFFSLIGYIMVAALPTETYRDRYSGGYETFHEQLKAASKSGGGSSVQISGGWTCTCGRSLPNVATSCVCGALKRNVVQNK